MAKESLHIEVLSGGMKLSFKVNPRMTIERLKKEVSKAFMEAFEIQWKHSDHFSFNGKPLLNMSLTLEQIGIVDRSVLQIIHQLIKVVYIKILNIPFDELPSTIIELPEPFDAKSIEQRVKNYIELRTKNSNVELEFLPEYGENVTRNNFRPFETIFVRLLKPIHWKRNYLSQEPNQPILLNCVNAQNGVIVNLKRYQKKKQTHTNISISKKKKTILETSLFDENWKNAFRNVWRACTEHLSHL